MKSRIPDMVTIPHRPTDSGPFGNSEWTAAAPFNVDDGKVKRCLQNRPNHRIQAVSVNSPWTGEVCKNTFKTSPISAATYDFPSYPAALTGQQIIPAADIPLTGPQARPSYVMTKWIIRVK